MLPVLRILQGAAGCLAVIGVTGPSLIAVELWFLHVLLPAGLPLSRLEVGESVCFVRTSVSCVFCPFYRFIANCVGACFRTGQVL